MMKYYSLVYIMTKYNSLLYIMMKYNLLVYIITENKNENVFQLIQD